MNNAFKELSKLDSDKLDAQHKVDQINLAIDTNLRVVAGIKIKPSVLIKEKGYPHKVTLDIETKGLKRLSLGEVRQLKHRLQQWEDFLDEMEVDTVEEGG